MKATSPALPRRRRVWRWILLSLGFCLAPFVILAVVAVSYLTLDRDAAALRKQVVAATRSDWRTKVQLSFGATTIDAVRIGLGFVHGRDRDLADAKLALQAVRHASVGVYQRAIVSDDWSREELFARADEAMLRRGWSRLVGVVDQKDTVLVYASPSTAADQPVGLCVAVVNGPELVVVSTRVDPATLLQLARAHSADGFKGHLKLSRLAD